MELVGVQLRVKVAHGPQELHELARLEKFARVSALECST